MVCAESAREFRTMVYVYGLCVWAMARGLFHAQMNKDSSLFTSRALQSLPMRPARSQHHVPNVE